MHWAASSEHSAALSVNVGCERCKEWFHYELRTTQHGQGRSTLPESAIERARDHAHAKAIAALATPQIVLCPLCNWLNVEMALELQRARTRWMKSLAIVCLFIAGLSWVVLPMKTLFTPEREIDPGDWSRVLHFTELVSFPALAIGMTLLMLRWLVLRGKIFPLSFPRPEGSIVTTALGVPGKANPEHLKRRVLSESCDEPVRIMN